MTRAHRPLGLVLSVALSIVGFTSKNLSAQDPYVSAHAYVGGAVDLGGEVGLWIPFFGGLTPVPGTIEPSISPAARAGISVTVRENESFVALVHTELGVGTARAYALTGPTFGASGDGRVQWGLRIAAGYHLRRKVTVGALALWTNRTSFRPGAHVILSL